MNKVFSIWRLPVFVCLVLFSSCTRQQYKPYEGSWSRDYMNVKGALFDKPSDILTDARQATYFRRARKVLAQIEDENVSRGLPRRDYELKILLGDGDAAVLCTPTNATIGGGYLIVQDSSNNRIPEVISFQ